MKTRIHNITLCPGAPDGQDKLEFISNAAIDIEDDNIIYAGPLADAQESATAGWNIIDGENCLAIPGLANAHTHAAMTLLRGLGGDLNLHDWLTLKIFPAEDRLAGDDIYYGSCLAFAEMLRFGVTACADMYMSPEQGCTAAETFGIRLSTFSPTLGTGDDDGGRLDKNVELYKLRNGTSNGRIRVMLGAHAEYTSSPEIIRRLVATAKEMGAPIHTHVSETLSEVEGCIARHGVSPVKYFADLGLFDMPTLAAHCVAIDSNDISILADKGVYVCHNPVSNLKLASGVSPIPALLKAGANVCLGTDGAASNNTLNLWEEIRLMSILHKGITGDPTVVSPAQTFRAATLIGARAMGFEHVGLIKAGWKADIVLVDRSGLHHIPMLEQDGDLVYVTQGSDVRISMVDGVVRYCDGQYPGINITDFLEPARIAAKRLTDRTIHA